MLEMLVIVMGSAGEHATTIIFDLICLYYT